MNQPNFRPILTKRLQLRPVRESDQPLVFEGLSNLDLTRYMLVHYPTLEASAEQMAYYQNQELTGVGYYWVMEDLIEQTGMGVIGFHNISIVHERAELGYWILPNHQRKGYVQEAAEALIRTAFEEHGFLRIEASVETGNAASRALLLRLGFRSEGVLRSYEWNRGNRIDLEWFGLVKTDSLK